MKQFTILGSCVSRDVFRVAEHKCNLNYFARSSLISLMSDPLLISDEDIKLESNFQKNMVLHDFNKNFFKEICADSIIVIDFIDERFNLMRYKESYVTYSNEFVNGKLMEVYPFERVSRHQKAIHELWKKSCILFFDKLLTIVSSENILIHETYWSHKYIDNGEVEEYQNQAVIEMNNKMLQDYYAFVRTSYPKLKFISSPRIGSKSHVWGLSPVHYTDDYYLNIYDQITSHIFE